MRFNLHHPALTPVLLICFAAVIIAGALAGSTEFRKLMFSPSSPGLVIFESELDGGAPGLREAAEVSGEPIFNGQGIGLNPGEHFSIRWKGKLSAGTIPYVRVWLVNGRQTNVQVNFEMAGQSQTLALPGNYTGLYVYPPEFEATERDEFYYITFTSSLPDSAQQPVMVLDRVQVGHKVFPAGTFDPNFWAAFVAALLPWALYELSFSVFGQKRSLAIAAGTAVMFSGALVVSPSLLPIFGFAATIILIGTAIFQLLRRSETPCTRKMEWMLISGILSVALWIRWNWLNLLVSSPLFPDAQHYFGLVSEMKWPYDTGWREPFIMWPIWLVQLFTAESELAQRLTTVFLSLAEGVALYWLCREFMSIRYAWIAPVLLALNPALSSNAVLGLREEALPLGWMTFLLGIVRAWKGDAGYRPHILMGIGAGIAILTRLNSAAALVPVYAVAWAIKRWNFKAVAITGMLSAFLIFPHMIRHAVVYGDAFKSMNLYQVSDVTKPPPNREVEEKKSILGRMFGHERFVPLTAKGSWNMIGGWSARNSFLRVQLKPETDRNFYPASLSHYSVTLARQKTLLDYLIYGTYLIGFVAILFRKGGWIVVSSLLLFVVPISFILEVADIREPRMLMNHVPLMLLCVGVGISEIFERSRQLLPHKSKGDRPQYGGKSQRAAKHRQKHS